MVGRIKWYWTSICFDHLRFTGSFERAIVPWLSSYICTGVAISLISANNCAKYRASWTEWMIYLPFTISYLQVISEIKSARRPQEA